MKNVLGQLFLREVPVIPVNLWLPLVLPDPCFYSTGSQAGQVLALPAGAGSGSISFRDLTGDTDGHSKIQKLLSP